MAKFPSQISESAPLSSENSAIRDISEWNRIAENLLAVTSQNGEITWLDPSVAQLPVTCSHICPSARLEVGSPPQHVAIFLAPALS